MTLYVHRSQRVKLLADALHAAIVAAEGGDPFASVPIVVGSRGMERWLRHELATRARSALCLDFLFPRGAFESAARALLADAAPDARRALHGAHAPPEEPPFGDPSFGDSPYRNSSFDEGPSTLFRAGRRKDDAWSGSLLVHRVLAALRAHLHDDAFAAVRTYLRVGEDGIDARRAAPVDAREARFATEVASVLERLHYDRPEDALGWARSPESAPAPHRWLATLLAELERGGSLGDADAVSSLGAPRPGLVGPSPAALLEALTRRRPARRPESLYVFGLSTLRPGDQRRLRALSVHLDVHLYLLAPSAEWWGDLDTHREQLRKLRAQVATQGAGSLDRDAQSTLFGANALLAANGLPSRDVQLWLETQDYHEEEQEQDQDRQQAPRRATLLGALQEWVDRADATPALGEKPWEPVDGCRSIELHACHGPLRQCEALRDELLLRFAEDATLEPRHVLVMTPDLPTYAPLLAAVFARTSPLPAGASRPAGARADEVPAIPVHIADLGLRETNAVAAALELALALTEERVTASALLGLLELWPVRARFGLEESDLAALRDLVQKSGVRWAWDAADRLRHTQPARDQNTVRFGLERLALGALMPDEDPLGAIDVGAERVLSGEGGSTALGPAAPLTLAAREPLMQFGAFAALCAALDEQRRALAAPATGPEWLARLEACVDSLTRVEDSSAWLRAHVLEVLAERLPATTGGALRLERRAVEALVGEAFELPTKGDRPVTGAVTVCAMEPMRSVPFRLIAMLGLDGGVFPRRQQPAPWDPFAEPRAGEHDRGALDRHLFLESLLCAQDAFLLFGTGFEPKRGQEVPLSMVATELEELVLRGVGRTVSSAKDTARSGNDAEAGSDATVSARNTSWPRRRHPLQPWSERAFPQSPRGGGSPSRHLPWTFDPVWFEARRALSEEPVPLVAPLDLGAWPAESKPPVTLRADVLARALENAPRALLKDRLGLYADSDEAPPSDREPLEADDLEKWQLRDRVLEALLAQRHASAAQGASGDAPGGPPPADAPPADAEETALVGRLAARLRAEGTLPLDAGGALLLDEACADARSILQKAEGTLGAPRTSHVELDGLRLTAVAPHTLHAESGELPVWFTASGKIQHHLALTAWISLLVMRAAGEPESEAVVFGKDETLRLEDEGDAARARLRLAELVSRWRGARAGSEPLFPRFSRKLAERDLASPDAPLGDLLDACREAWEGGSFERSALADPWVSRLYADVAVEELAALGEPLRDAARAVWGGLLAATKQSRGSKTAGRAGGGDEGGDA